MSNLYSLSFNRAKFSWQAKVKQEDGSWKTKWLPKNMFNSTQQVDAERYLIGWIASDKEAKTEPKAASLTISLLAERWLQLRYNDTGTKPNTYGGLAQSMHNWILTNDKFIHTKIDHLDIQTELSVEVLRNWISSMTCSRSSKLSHITALRSFFRDSLAEGWLPESLTNPLDKPAIKKLCMNLAKARRENHLIITVSTEQIAALLSARFIPDFRKLRYLTAICTGLRDHEVQGLIWSDIDFSKKIIRVQRQLDKIGVMPVKTYDELVEQGLSKVQIKALPNAIVSNPKRNSKRELPMHPVLLDALTWWHNVGYKKHVLKSPESQMPVFGASSHHATRDYMTKDGSGIAKKAGSLGDFCHPDSAMVLKDDLKRCFPDLVSVPSNFHALRHQFASSLEQTGASREHIGDLLGHSAGMTSHHYIEKRIETYAKLVSALPMPEVRFSSTVISAYEPASVAG